MNLEALRAGRSDHATQRGWDLAVAEHEAALASRDAEIERLRADRQKWLDEDVKNTDAIECLESERDALETALEPFVAAKPMPGVVSHRYVLHVSGDALGAARAALASTSDEEGDDG